LEWTASTQEAFQNAKRLLAVAVPLQHPAPNAELSLATDTPDIHIGGVMQQKSGDQCRPFGFFSRKLTGTESRYSTFDRKLLAAQATIKHFRPFVKVTFSNFGLTTNPLLPPCHEFLYQSRPDNSAIWCLFQFNLQLLYLPGLKNVVADCLTYPQPTGSVATTMAADPVGFEEMVAEQNRYAETQRLLGGTSLKLAFCQTGTHLAGDVSTGVFSLFHSNSEKTFSIIFIMLLTPGGFSPIILFHPGLCGVDYSATSPPGPARVWPASGAAHSWPPNPSPSLNGIFLTFMWIWWAHYSTVTASIIFLPFLITHQMDGSYSNFLNVRSVMR
jgi:hypothetical protein